MKKKRGIRFKITSLTLVSALSALFLLGAVTAADLFYVRQSVGNANRELGERAARDSNEALEAQTLQRLNEITKNMSKTANEQLTAIQTYSKILASSATAVFSSPEKYLPASISPPLMENKDQLALYYISPGGLMDTQMNQQAGLAANCKDILYNVPALDKMVTACYISFDSGLHVVCDTASAIRLEPGAEYDPRKRSWYQEAHESGETVFSDIVNDAQGRGLGIVCSTPFQNANGETIGVVGIGALLKDINDLVLDTNVGETGSAFILNEKGQIIISPDIQKDDNGTIIRKNLLESEDPTIREIAGKMMDGEEDVILTNWNNQQAYLAYYPLESIGWSIATVVSYDEAMALSQTTQSNINRYTQTASDRIEVSLFSTILVTLTVMGIASCGILIGGTKAAKRLTVPLKTLTDGVKEISGGNLNMQLDICTGDEIESLASSFTEMTRELKEYMENLTRVTAEKERIATELAVATQIQTSMLPCIFPAFPERDEFDIYATMQAAKEVGGDFYDFFLIDETHLGVVIADVSGKGVPAALFMVIAKTLIKNHIQSRLTPAEAFEAVNQQLCENNEAGMFVTAIAGILEVESGKFTYVNAGHNRPLISQNGGAYEWLPLKPGFVLAGMEGMRYQQQEIFLSPGDYLFLYTDGVTEALNPAEKLYSDQRLISLFNSGTLDGKAENDLLRLVRLDITEFADGAPQADDITMLMLRYNNRRILNGSTDSACGAGKSE